MKFLKIISDKNIKHEDKRITDQKKWKKVRAGYGIILNKENKIALVYMKNRRNHILPGGKLENKETYKQALKRECQEEIGFDIDIKKFIGRIKEIRNRQKQIRISQCYLARTKGGKKNNIFTTSEKEKGAKVIWMNINKAIKIYQKDNPLLRKGEFVRKRDLVYLIKTKKLI